jgi:dimethylargininase
MIALTRAVPPSFNACELTYQVRQTIDLPKAREQHAEYERALVRLGCRVEQLPPLPDRADSVFVEDTAFVVDEIAVLTRPGVESRRPELPSVRAALATFRKVVSLEPPATLEGGDVLRVGRTVYVGLSKRTNAQGVVELQRILRPFGYLVTPVPFGGCLHLKSAATPVAEDTLLLNPEWVDPGLFTGLAHIPVDPAEPVAANVLHLDGTVLIAAAHPRTASRLCEAGFKVEVLEVQELAKAEAGLTCCSLIFGDRELGGPGRTRTFD